MVEVVRAYLFEEMVDTHCVRDNGTNAYHWLLGQI